ncbi:MAG: enolase C-terminal domain-like protein [Minicystis sp.]
MRLVGSRIQRSSRPRSGVFLQLFDEDGRVGQGEAAPLPPFSREDAEGCARALERAHERVGVIEDRAGIVEAIGAALRPMGRALDDVPAARFALETAIFDLIGQRLGVSVAACLGGEAAYASVPVNALLVAPPVETLADRAAAVAAEGYEAIKIKLRAADDAGFSREVEALRAVRARLPLPYEIRLDPNAAWSEEEARRRMEALAPIAPRFVEQPMAADRLHRLGACAVPWAADESLVDPSMVERLLSARGCAAFVIKPHVLGGLLRAREIAVQAQERGIEVVVTHFFDGPFAMAAACEVAMSLPRAPLSCGLAAHEMLAGFAANFGGVEIPQLAERGVVRSSGPGLGVRSTWVCDGHG